jgi:4-hydroxybenzoate polyprenyltransferase
MEGKTLESAAPNYSYLRGLHPAPVGILLIVAALYNWEWGPLRHVWVFVACVLAAGAAGLAISRYYSEHYGRVTPSARQQVRTAAAASIGAALMLGVGFLARSRASWSLDLPVNPTAAGFALFMLTYYALTVGLRAHHIIIWGSVLVTGLLPVWGGVGLGDTGNIGLVIAGMAAIATGIFDHRLLVRTFGSPQDLDLESGNARA